MNVSSSRLIVLKNAVANVVRGSAAALVALIVPPFLVRALPYEVFSVWSLVLQLSMYTAFLDFGIQTAVARFVAYTTESGDVIHRNRIVSTSFALLTGAAISGILLVVVLSWQLPHLFSELPVDLINEARIALLVVGGGAALGLPASVYIGVFVGLQRSEVPAIILAGSRLLSAFLLVLVANSWPSILLLAVVTSAINIISYVLQYWACRKIVLDLHVAWRLLSTDTAKEIVGYCFSLSIWSFATLLITGIDLALVGVFDFSAVAYYAIATSLITFILGLQNALFGTLIPVSAAANVRNDHSVLSTMLISSTRYSVFILLLTGLPLITAADGILTIWVGSKYAVNATILLQVLVVANIIRLSALPYTMLLIGTAQQRLVTVTPLIEGCLNLIISVIAGSFLGAIGVALGTLVGSVIGVACHLFINMPRTKGINIDRKQYAMQGLVRPLICSSPFLCILFADMFFLSLTAFYQIVLVGMSTMVTLGLFWRWGLQMDEQHTISRFVLSPVFVILHKWQKLNQQQSN